MYPGQMVAVGKNLLNFVLVADLGTAEGVGLITAAHNLYTQQMPVRFGLIPVLTGALAKPLVYNDLNWKPLKFHRKRESQTLSSRTGCKFQHGYRSTDHYMSGLIDIQHLFPTTNSASNRTSPHRTLNPVTVNLGPSLLLPPRIQFDSNPISQHTNPILSHRHRRLLGGMVHTQHLSACGPRGDGSALSLRRPRGICVPGRAGGGGRPPYGSHDAHDG